MTSSPRCCSDSARCASRWRTAAPRRRAGCVRCCGASRCGPLRQQLPLEVVHRSSTARLRGSGAVAGRCLRRECRAHDGGRRGRKNLVSRPRWPRPSRALDGGMMADSGGRTRVAAALETGYPPARVPAQVSRRRRGRRRPGLDGARRLRHQQRQHRPGHDQLLQLRRPLRLPSRRRSPTAASRAMASTPSPTTSCRKPPTTSGCSWRGGWPRPTPRWTSSAWT